MSFSSSSLKSSSRILLLLVSGRSGSTPSSAPGLWLVLWSVHGSGLGSGWRILVELLAADSPRLLPAPFSVPSPLLSTCCSGSLWLGLRLASGLAGLLPTCLSLLRRYWRTGADSAPCGAACRVVGLAVLRRLGLVVG